jgi:hypothetical protein
MANILLPLEERNLTPDQVEALDKRRDLGHTLLVVAGQFVVMAMVLSLWVARISNTRLAGITPCSIILPSVWSSPWD